VAASDESIVCCNILHLVVPVYGLMRGLPGNFSTPSSLQRISMVRSSTGCMLIKSARDSAGSKRFATAAVYARHPLTCTVGMLSTSSEIAAKIYFSRTSIGTAAIRVG